MATKRSEAARKAAATRKRRAAGERSSSGLRANETFRFLFPIALGRLRPKFLPLSVRLRAVTRSVPSVSDPFGRIQV